MVAMGMSGIRTNNMCSSNKIVVYSSYLQKVFDVISLNLIVLYCVFINIVQLLVNR